MTQTSYPWTGTTTGDAGPYSAGQWQLAWQAFLRNNIADDTSYIPGTATAGTEPLNVVTLTNLDIEVREGLALIQGIFYSNDAPVKFSLDPNNNANGYDRIDRVVLRADYNAQTVRLAVLKGTPAASPSPPSLTQTATVYEAPIAQILVQFNASSLTSGDITDERVSSRFFDEESGAVGKAPADINQGSILVGTAGGGSWGVVTFNPSPSEVLISTQFGDGVVTRQVVPDVAYSNDTYGLGSSFTQIEFDGLDSGNFASVNGSGQLVLENGVYLIRFSVHVFDNLGGTTFFEARLYDPVNAVVLSGQEAGIGESTNTVNSGRIETAPLEYTFGAQRTFELQALADNGNGAVTGLRAAWVEVRQLV